MNTWMKLRGAKEQIRTLYGVSEHGDRVEVEMPVPTPRLDQIAIVTGALATAGLILFVMVSIIRFFSA